mmetsp:Transcript_5180/g.16744  ORF Transcript_5180/g.16744 Transcript_5180/m.16744 type:complete len:244 (+) Transcript_5180:585-1316(+)
MAEIPKDLRSHEEGCATNRHALLLRAAALNVNELAHAEVTQVRHAGLRDQDVVSLDIAMYQSAVMKALERTADVVEHHPCSQLGQRVVHDDLTSTSPIDELHDDHAHLWNAAIQLLTIQHLSRRCLVESWNVLGTRGLAREPRLLNLGGKRGCTGARHQLNGPHLAGWAAALPDLPEGALPDASPQSVLVPRSVGLHDQTGLQDLLHYHQGSSPRRPEHRRPMFLAASALAVCALAWFIFPRI